MNESGRERLKAFLGRLRGTGNARPPLPLRQRGHAALFIVGNSQPFRCWTAVLTVPSATRRPVKGLASNQEYDEVALPLQERKRAGVCSSTRMASDVRSRLPILWVTLRKCHSMPRIE